MPADDWKLISSRQLSDHRIFRLHADRYRLEPEGNEGDFVRIESCDWVNVIALTPDDQVVLIRQFRHGIRDVTLEVPGGMIDAGESPEQAALRELREETGYAASSAQALGHVWPNPAIQDNRCYSILVERAEKVAEPRPEAFERIVVATRPLAEVPALISSGAIRHALVVVAFAMMGVVPGRG